MFEKKNESLVDSGEQIRRRAKIFSLEHLAPSTPSSCTFVVENEKMKIESCVEIVQRLSRPLAPEPTGESTQLPDLSKIRAIVFDVYGTLLQSGVGDISLVQSGADSLREAAARTALEDAGFEIDSNFGGLAEQLMEGIQLHQKVIRESGIEWPEIDIREVWHVLISTLAAKGLILGKADKETIERVSINFECRVNGVWPMPGMQELIEHLRDKQVPLGIVSNAQWFTPLLFDALVDKSIHTLGFNRELCVWSWELREAKPSTRLYAEVCDALQKRGIEPSETLYIGNDRRNDVAPAMAVGLRTLLFAGDRRSLRWRHGDSVAGDTQPSGILAALPDLIPALP